MTNRLAAVVAVLSWSAGTWYAAPRGSRSAADRLENEEEANTPPRWVKAAEQAETLQRFDDEQPAGGASQEADEPVEAEADGLRPPPALFRRPLRCRSSPVADLEEEPADDQGDTPVEIETGDSEESNGIAEIFSSTDFEGFEFTGVQPGYSAEALMQQARLRIDAYPSDHKDGGVTDADRPDALVF